MRISDWSSDVCSSDLVALHLGALLPGDREDPVEVVAHYSSLGRHRAHGAQLLQLRHRLFAGFLAQLGRLDALFQLGQLVAAVFALAELLLDRLELFVQIVRSEEHTSELQSLMRTSYAVFCLKKKKTITQ